MSQLAYHHRFVAGTDPAAPPLIVLHGTGGDENDLIPLAQDISPGSAVLSPRGDVLEHGARRFFSRLAEGVFDPAEIIRRTHALADFIAAATGHYGLDPAKLTALGFSNGANIAGALLLLRPESLAAALLLRPMVVLESPVVPGLSGKRILISSGAADPIVPSTHPAQLAALFRRGGAEVTLQVQRAGHGLVPADLASARNFLLSP